MAILKNDWAPLLADQFEAPYYLALREFLKQQYHTSVVYPNMHDIFNALHATPYANVRVVILGQDPYHGPNQAHGLSFSVRHGVQVPRSLQNMFKERYDDIGIPPASHGNLAAWTEQGVLLLNTVLTVRAGEANSHRNQGWERFTDRIIQLLNERERPIAFVLWGRPAQTKKAMITNKHHLVLEAPHPSPLSAARGFFGSKPYSKINDWLISQGDTPIDWRT